MGSSSLIQLNGYETGSYNYMGNGFVQVDKTVYLGSSLHPVSQISGQQFALDFYLYRVSLPLFSTLTLIFTVMVYMKSLYILTNIGSLKY